MSYVCQSRESRLRPFGEDTTYTTSSTTYIGTRKARTTAKTRRTA